MTRRGLLVTVLVLGGCAYYNGMYNANRLADQAEKAELDGRRFEAQNLWALAAIKADSVIARHPDSKWYDDALLIKGKSLARRKNCQAALVPLERVVYQSPDSATIRQATLLLGQCHYQLGNVAEAHDRLQPLVAYGDPSSRAVALPLYGITLNRAERHAEALEVFVDLADPDSDWERAMALAGSGQVTGAVALADSLIARHDSAVVWDTLLMVFGRHDLAQTSGLVDRLIKSDSLGGERNAELLLNDGLRWVEADRAIAQERLLLSAEEPRSTRWSAEARLRLAVLVLEDLRDRPGLDSALALLAPVSVTAGPSALTARRLVTSVENIRSVLDNVSDTVPGADVDMFLAAEAVRDILQAEAFARSLFRSIPETWPNSPYAPKAVLALAALDPENAPAYHQTLLYLYPDSPYVEILAGIMTEDLASLEDSLQNHARARLIERQATQPDQRRQRRANRARDDENLEELP